MLIYELNYYRLGNSQQEKKYKQLRLLTVFTKINNNEVWKYFNTIIVLMAINMILIKIFILIYLKLKSRMIARNVSWWRYRLKQKTSNLGVRIVCNQFFPLMIQTRIGEIVTIQYRGKKNAKNQVFPCILLSRISHLPSLLQGNFVLHDAMTSIQVGFNFVLSVLRVSNITLWPFISMFSVTMVSIIDVCVHKRMCCTNSVCCQVTEFKRRRLLVRLSVLHVTKYSTCKI